MLTTQPPLKRKCTSCLLYNRWYNFKQIQTSLMKKHLLTLVLIVVTSTGFGQVYKSFLPSPQFTKALESIVLDFRLDYKNIQGNLVDSLGQQETYVSAVKLPGIADCRILRFHSTMDTTACWQAIVYSGDSYKEAVRAYENTV